MTDAQSAAAAFLAASGLGMLCYRGAEEKKEPKKKKKKKKTGCAAGAAKEEKKEPPKAVSAKGRMIAERLAKQREEEEAARKLQEEEEKRIKEEEEREEAARRAVEEEKAKKKERERLKREKKKADGTYKTKKQKEQEARAAAALEAMKAAGIEVPMGKKGGSTPSANDKKEAVAEKVESAKSSCPPLTAPEVPKATEGAPAPAPAEEAAAPEQVKVRPLSISSALSHHQRSESAGAAAACCFTTQVELDDWEAADDWDTADVTAFAAPVQMATEEPGFDEEEDLIELEKKQEQEKLRLAGLRREKLEAERKLEEERLRAEEEAREEVVLMAQRHKEDARKRRLERETLARQNRSPNTLRSPIVCIMGHVDTGKTKLLDKIRQTSVQEGEAGGITQQIGATFFAQNTLADKISTLQLTDPLSLKIPGMLIIDTPGHESFTNLRSRGSSLCDIAILVIDLMHGLEPQTVESLNLLRSRRTPFVVALNKVDRCYGWKSTPDGAVRESLANQDSNTTNEFHDRAERVRTELMEKGLNAELYWNNSDPANTVSLIPTSAITGEGIPDILMRLAHLSQDRLTQQIMFMPDLLQCTVLEVKVIEGLGTTIDCILVNGKLHENERIVVCSLDGPIVSTIRAVLTPPPSRELRIKSEYVHHKEIFGAIGVKICANGIERAVAGTPVMVIGPDDDEEDIKEEVMKDFEQIMKMDIEKQGVLVQASTLGALEALMQFLRKECNPPIPVSAVGIGPVFKKDVIRASVMLEKGSPEYATILAFDVKIDADARTYADENGVRIFTADIIYHLFDQFTNFMAGLQETRRAEAVNDAVFPCIAKVLPEYVFNKKDPIIVGIEVIEGNLRIGTPLCIPAKDGLRVGRVASIEDNHKEVDKLAKGKTASVRIVGENGGSTLEFGRHFDANSGSLYSNITRASIDALKMLFRDQLTKDDLRLLIKYSKSVLFAPSTFLHLALVTGHAEVLKPCNNG
ncbi:unnamed protein product [Chrysoparadoxa australica]